MPRRQLLLRLRTQNRLLVTLLSTAFLCSIAVLLWLRRPSAESYFQGFESGSRSTESNNCWVFQAFDVRTSNGSGNLITGTASARSGPLTGTSNYLTSPIVLTSSGSGTLTFKHFVHSLAGSSGKYLQLILVDYVTKEQDTVWTYTYSNTTVQTESIEISHAGAYKLVWRAWGTGGTGRVWLDDISIPGSMIDTPGSCGTPNNLPVVLSGFEAKMSGFQALISWSTTSELNSSHFEVERSLDGNLFETMGQVSSTGNSNQSQDYTFSDKTAGAISGHVYYRLRMVDVDGTFSYAPAIELIRDGQLVELQLIRAFPNPTRDVFAVEVFLPEAGIVTFEMGNLAGRQLLKKTWAGAPGLQTWETDLSTLPAGIYLYTLTHQQATLTGKVIKQ